jgi:ribosome-binding protein aMBF1 (putative translation factor)
MVAGTIQIKGQRFVIIPEREYDALLHCQPDGRRELPPLPKRLRNGNFDAVAYASSSLARKLIRDRKAAGQSLAELARLAKIPIETLTRIEQAELTPSVAMVKKIDRALAKAGEK